VANPAFNSVIYDQARPGVQSPAAWRAYAVLAGQDKRIAEAGQAGCASAKSGPRT